MRIGRRAFLRTLPAFVTGSAALEFGLAQATRETGRARFNADATQVLIPFTAEDKRHHFVDGLTAGDVRLLADGLEQHINFLSVEDAPASILFVVDISGSMKKAVAGVREALQRMLRAAAADDEFALIEFASEAELTVDFTAMTSRLEERIGQIAPAGHTSLSDAMLLALGEIKRAHQPRRALIVVSDGRENHSRHVRSEALRAAVDTDARIYAIELYPPAGEGVAGPGMLETLARASGGRYLPTVKRQDIPALIEQIDIHRGYVLGFTPPAEHRNGKLHQVNLKLRHKIAGPPVRLFWKERYRIPAVF